MSYDASGTIADSITFSKWKGRNYVRRHATPSNPKSTGQVATRAMMRFLTTSWAGLSAAQKATWGAGAASLNISPFNYYVKYNMDRWTQYQRPHVTPNAAPLTDPVLGAQSISGGTRQYTVSQVITTLNDGWGIELNQSPTAVFTPSKSTVKYVANMVASLTNIVITNVLPGNYWIEIRAFQKGGTSFMAFGAEMAVTVT